MRWSAWVVAVLMAALSFSVSSRAHAAVIDLSPAELEQLIAKGVPVIDIRTAPEWAETGVVQGSHLLTFFDERGAANPANWLAKAQQFTRPDAPVILICRSGNRTRDAGRFLSERAGFKTVYHVKGGIKAWAAERRPTVAAQPILAACKAANTC